MYQIVAFVYGSTSATYSKNLRAAVFATLKGLAWQPLMAAAMYYYFSSQYKDVYAVHYGY
jgi:hypothetical protein